MKRGVKDSPGVFGVLGVLGVLVGGAPTIRPVGTISGGLESLFIDRDRYWVGGQETGGPVGTSVANGSADAGFGFTGEELISVISLIFMIFNGASLVEALSLASLIWCSCLVTTYFSHKVVIH